MDWFSPFYWGSKTIQRERGLLQGPGLGGCPAQGRRCCMSGGDRVSVLPLEVQGLGNLSGRFAHLESGTPARVLGGSWEAMQAELSVWACGLRVLGEMVAVTWGG